MIHIFPWAEPEAIPIDLAPLDGTYVLVLWRDQAGDRFGCIAAYAWLPGLERYGWRPRGGDEVVPTHWVAVPVGF